MEEREKEGEEESERHRGGSKVRVFRPRSRLNHFHPHPTGQTQFMAPSDCKGGWDVESGICRVSLCAMMHAPTWGHS